MMVGLTQSYTCGASSKPIIYETIGNHFEGVVAQYPDTEALVVCHQDVRWTYAEFQFIFLSPLTNVKKPT